MIHNDYMTHLKVCEFLDKEPIGQYKKIHDYITGLWDELEIVVDSRSNKIVFQKQQEWFFEQDNKNGFLWCNYEQAWSFFKVDMGTEDTETEDFIKTTVEQHLKCKVGTPAYRYPAKDNKVEQHLKCKVGTPIVKDMTYELQ